MTHFFKYCLALGLFIIGCQAKSRPVHRVENHKVIEIIRFAPRSIHDEISPKTKAVLSNGDTVPCTSYRQVGDIITYIYYDADSTNTSNPR